NLSGRDRLIRQIANQQETQAMIQLPPRGDTAMPQHLRRLTHSAAQARHDVAAPQFEQRPVQGHPALRAGTVQRRQPASVPCLLRVRIGYLETRFPVEISELGATALADPRGELGVFKAGEVEEGSLQA